MTIGFHEKKEKQLLQVSFYAAALFVVIALGFALYTHSSAILFDGIYSLIAFFMALLTLKVANLVQLPDDDRFHFGYTAIEPTLNLFKSLIIIATCLYAVVNSINTLMSGGNSAQYDLAMVYGIIATVGCFAVSGYMKHHGKALRSDLVGVDAHTWFVDGVLSASILAGFAMAYALDQSGWASLSPYVDPILLIVLGVAILPIPVKIMLDSLKEVINKAPPEAVTAVIEKKLKKTLSDVPYKHVEVRISKSGRDLYLLVHIIVDDSFSIATISELDDIRLKCEADMRQWDPSIIMDILFITKPELAD
ncbi:cation diffusion facilitator family transporter [Alteromonas oceanisediminis]|uniref:cation diffusion facilitator family transporter n=1 Tax=Alteromonas oceanisediminis TaxID=2836180 RepID=UPI001BD9D340|nr:cation diffusion facilitator family transporter [Alteromonas oceanisediminis]MBT0587289.1 cation diffusion facilitator family transporter [Alteromonas oceanisediminis]